MRRRRHAHPVNESQKKPPTNPNTMTPSLRLIIAIALTSFLCIGSTGCKPKTVGSSNLATTVGGREIRAVIQGAAFIQPGSDDATISFSGHKVTVERARVVLDGTELATLPPAATKVEVTVSGGQLTVTADGAAITTKQLGK